MAHPVAIGGDSDDKDNAHPANSAQATALRSMSERQLRVACFCEENVWRLTFRRLQMGSHECGQSSRNDADGNKQPRTADGRYFVVFISNKNRCCPMQYQIARGENFWKPCFWDYHVIFLLCSTEQSLIFDMDSHLPFPSLVEDYLSASFDCLERVDAEQYHEYAPMFRVIPAELYLEHFYSDRMHMYDASKGQWSASPPTYDCIMDGLKVGDQPSSTADNAMGNSTMAENATTQVHGAGSRQEGKGGVSNLDCYIDMTRHDGRQGEIGIYGQVFTLDDFRAKHASSKAA